MADFAEEAADAADAADADDEEEEFLASTFSYKHVLPRKVRR